MIELYYMNSKGRIYHGKSRYSRNGKKKDENC